MQICLKQVIFARGVDSPSERINRENQRFDVILRSGWIQDAC